MVVAPEIYLLGQKIMTLNSKRTCLWFLGNGEEAAEFYVSLIPGSKINSAYKSDPDQPQIVIEFTLANINS